MGVMDRLDGFWAAAVAACVIGILRGGFDGPARGLCYGKCMTAIDVARSSSQSAAEGRAITILGATEVNWRQHA